MSRIFHLLFKVLALAGSACAATLFPLPPGTNWEYTLTDSSAQPGTVISVTIAAAEQVNGTDAVRLETRRDDVLEKTELIATAERGLVCLARSWPSGRSVSFDPPQQLFPADAKIGSTWELDDDVAGSSMHQRFTIEAEENVVVPAGTFHAYRLACAETWPLSVAIQRWFAPRVGVIKEMTTTRGPNGRLVSRTTLALRKFTPAVTQPLQEKPTISIVPQASPTPPAVAVTVAQAPDGAPASKFRSDVPNLYLHWKAQHLPLGATVRIAWVAEDVGDVAPANFVVDQREFMVGTPDSRAQITLSRPRDGWAAGKYRAEFYLDDRLLQSTNVTISD
ncbi:MAG: hypothetical protein M3Z22_07005 [Verrucomicrobiota bacterium]|nr:hypothetical protein [Verrucomicrobiota bacterium]